MHVRYENIRKYPHAHPIINFVLGFKYKYMYIQKYLTGIFECDFVSLVFSNNIFNLFIIYIWFNVTNIIPSFNLTINFCDRTIGSTMRYLIWLFIWPLIFEISIISEHDFISNFIVIVYHSYIFADIISISLPPDFNDVLVTNLPFFKSG